MPKLSDAEVITMEIVGEFMGKDHDNWHSANRFIRKLLAHTMGCFLWKLLAPLAF